MGYNYSNISAQTTLASGISSTNTAISLQSNAGLPVQFPFTLIIDYGEANVEVVTVTSLAGTNYNVTRGEDGTAAQNHNTGAVVVHGVVARDLKAPQDHMAASTGVHGVASSVVGTTDAQTLSNKDIDGSNNTLHNIPDSAVTAISASKLTGNFNGGSQFVASGDTVVPLAAKATGAATAPAFEVWRGTNRQAYWGPFGEIVTNASVTSGGLTLPGGDTLDIGAWKTYTPVLRGSTTNPTYTAGTLAGKYMYVNKHLVAVQVVINPLAGGTKGTGTILCTLPLQTTDSSYINGTFNMLDNNVTNLSGVVGFASSNLVCAFQRDGDQGSLQWSQLTNMPLLRMSCMFEI